MKPSRGGVRIIDVLKDFDSMGNEAVRCYNATTHVYYLTEHKRYPYIDPFFLLPLYLE